MNNDVLVREVTQDELPVLFDQQLEPDAIQMASFPPREWDAFLTHWTNILADCNVTKRTILSNGQVAGYILGFEQDGKTHVGYWLGKKYWGQGIATRALKQFLDHVKVRPLYANVTENHIASIKVLKNCGFTITGYKKDITNSHNEHLNEVILVLGCEKEKKVK